MTPTWQPCPNARNQREDQWHVSYPGARSDVCHLDLRDGSCIRWSWEAQVSPVPAALLQVATSSTPPSLQDRGLDCTTGHRTVIKDKVAGGRLKSRPSRCIASNSSEDTFA